ncbi:bifunctional [glutamate--ammonia ligase]-adenylyl-L-tyrosine phosphorylase/[glutamate--ammonia-ligase] adenylyltransferase [Agaribacter flavus]|uniref:Bifunctional glutamine synthetase adenylyltransferase/adenylyl-removing enzyme n=1 Tax=Agaribacter flavus TaxID=1902781 RepID=A0ABV7FNB0_9ALTE
MSLSEADVKLLSDSITKHFPNQHAIDDDFSDECAALSQVFILSDFVCRVAKQFSAQFSAGFYTLINTPNKQQDYYALCKKAAEDSTNELELDTAIRTIRQVQMSLVACADLLELQSIETSMRKVSSLADALIYHTYRWHYHKLAYRYGYPITTEGKKQHLQLMAMGKLGGQELNFSSDIDLIFAYPSVGETNHPRKPIENQVFFIKLAQKLINALDKINQFGQVYRVDMRLRPLGESGPLVIPFSAFENYYQEQGREWERFAMQKMRIINESEEENKAFAQELYAIVKPFVYRKYLDFTAIDSIREMKTLIEKEVRRKQIKQNIKLGKGGIREIEFFVQSLQLIHAGRHPACQQKSLIDALEALKSAAFIDAPDYSRLREHYLSLRKIEQYLQIFDDAQTQTLPQSEINQARLTRLLKKQNYQQCVEEIERIMDDVHTLFKYVIATPDEQDTPAADIQTMYHDLWLLQLVENEQITILSTVLCEAHSRVLINALNNFKEKVNKSSLSENAQRSLARLIPVLLAELCESEQGSFSNKVTGIFKIITTILGRTTYIDLLEQSIDARQRLIQLCEKSTWLATQIAHFPMLLDELLHPSYLSPDTRSLEEVKHTYKADLRQFLLRVSKEDDEAQMDALRQFKHIHQLRIAAADVSDTISINKVSDHLTVLAEVIIEEVVLQAWQHTSGKFGHPKLDSIDESFAIVGYGKLGGYELSYGSDLDIVCLYNAKRDDSTDHSGTRNPISNQQFFVKLVQRISHLCITQTYQGILYEIDLRLRPSGNSGLLISHINSFEEYQQSEAWTWEHQALVRARVIYGNGSIQTAFERIRHQVLCQARDTQKLAKDIYDMREKMRTHLDKTSKHHVDIKQTRGGIVDIEFGVQFLVLLYASEFPALAKWSDNLRILEEVKLAGLYPNDAIDSLKSCFLNLRNIGHKLQLDEKETNELSENLREILSSVEQNSPMFSLVESLKLGNVESV